MDLPTVVQGIDKKEVTVGSWTRRRAKVTSLGSAAPSVLRVPESSSLPRQSWG